MNDTDTCYCGHVRDEHGGDPDYPTNSGCNVEGCHCIAFEADEDDE